MTTPRHHDTTTPRHRDTATPPPSRWWLERLLLGAVLVFGLAQSARANSVLYDDFGPGQGYNPNYGWQVGANYGWEIVVAMPFISGGTATLADVQIPGFTYGGVSNPLNVYLESNNGGVPGTILDSLTGPEFGFSSSIVGFTCSTCSVLTAGTEYWVVALQPDPNNITVWDFTSPSFAENVAENLDNSPIGPWFIDGGQDFGAFEVDGRGGTTTPEPGTLLLFGSGLLTLGGVLRRKA